MDWIAVFCSSLSCKTGIIIHHSDTVGLNLCLCDPWMEGASNETSSHRIRLFKKSLAWRRSWCQGASVGSSVNPTPERVMWRSCGRKHCLRPEEKTPCSAKAIASICNNRIMNTDCALVICKLQHLLHLCFCLLWPPLEEETSNITGVKVTSESPWEQWCSGYRSSPSKNHSETNRHCFIWGMKVSEEQPPKSTSWWAKALQTPDYFSQRIPLSLQEDQGMRQTKFCAIQVVIDSWGVAWRPECSGQWF